MTRPDRPDSPPPGLVAPTTIRAAAARIAPYLGRTPVIPMTPTGLRLKAESLHATGSFKLRGAFNSILMLDEATRRRGVIAHSSGNHAQAVAYAARTLGVSAVVVMPDNASRVKLEATRAWGAEIVQVDASLRSETCHHLARARGLAELEPYDSPHILAATGTIGLEILEQCPDVRTVAVPISGGGLIGGIAAAIRQSNPDVRIVGVEPELANDAAQSFRAGHIVRLTAAKTARTMADGLRVTALGAWPWQNICEYVSDVLTVSENAIADAVRRIASEARLVAEPSGAVATAGVLAAGLDPGSTVAVLSGGNVELPFYASLLAGD